MREYRAEREAHIACATPGVVAAKALCDMTDRAVRDLSRTASCRAVGRWAVIALGGWGSRALLPNSDLDILILCEGHPERMRDFSQALLYPLWDAGLKVGHQVRSPAEHRKALKDDIKSLTAGLTARTVEGDATWADAVLSDSVRWATKQTKRRLREIASRARVGNPYLLGTDLKEGCGGRRDFDELVWLAAVGASAMRCRPDDLVAQGLLTEAELQEACDAEKTIAEARWTLQRDGWGDRFTADSPLNDLQAQALQTALIATASVLDRARERLAGSTPPSKDVSPEELFALLDEGASSIPDLWRLARDGRAENLVPGMRDLMALRRPGLGHELTVGAHCVKAAALVADFGADGGLLGGSVRHSDKRVVQTAALLHDIGKTTPGPGHAERGFALARDPAARLLDDETKVDVTCELVRLHLRLAEFAASTNLDDEDAVLQSAGAIGELELLAPLHVLTAADSMATGPGTWSLWESALVSTLVSRIDVALSPQVDGAGLVDKARDTREAALRLLAREDDSHFVATAPLRYLASNTPEQIVRHAELVGELSRTHGATCRISVGSGPVPETHRVTYAASSGPDLLARLAGAMSLAGLDILGLDVYTAPESIALVDFVVKSATRRPCTSEVFASLQRLVDLALHDRLELAARLDERRRHYPPKVDAPTTVRVETAGWDTALHLSAPDRPGLLYDVARVVSANALEIRWARGQTLEGVARDVFHVSGPEGGPVADAGVLGHICASIREVV